MSTKAEDRPEQQTVGEGWRLPVVFLTLAGLSLVVMGQAVYQASNWPNFGPWHWLLYLLILAGLLLFLLPGFFVARTRLPSWITSPLRRLANYLSISSGQLTLILISPPFGLMAYLAAGDGPLAHNLIISLAA